MDFKALFEALPGNFIVLQPNPPQFTILAISEPLLQNTALQREQVVGRGLFEVYPANPAVTPATGPDCLRDSLHKALDNKKQDQMPVVRYDVPLAGGAFETRYWSPTNKPVLNAEGEVLYLIHATTDVTQEVLSREKAAENEDHFRRLIEESPVATSLFIGKEMVLSIANDAMLALLGKGASIMGKPLQQAISDLENQPYVKALEEVFISGKAYAQKAVEVLLVTAGVPTVFYFDLTYKPLFNAAGEVSGVLTVAVDVSELVSDRRKLQDSERQIRSFMESSHHPIGVYVGREMRIGFANQALIMGLGKGKDIIGKPYKEVLPELENQGIFEQLDHVFTTGRPFHAQDFPLELLIDGIPRTCYFNFSFAPLFDGAGAVWGIINTGADVTDLHRARQKEEESARALRHLANAMPQLVWIAEANGDVTYYNDRVEAFSGAKKAPDGTWSWQGLLLPQDQHATEEAWRRAVAQGTTYEIEHRVQTADGRYRWLLSRAFPQRDKTGAIVKWYGTATDIHEQKENQEALRRSEEQLRIALEGAELGTFTLYPQRNELFWSDKTKELMGLPPAAQVRPETFFQALHPDDRERSRVLIQEAFRPENGGGYENEFRVIGLQNGRLRWLRSKGKVSFDEEGRVLRFTGVTQDVTEQKQAEAALEQKNAQLIRINNDLDNFIYTASHDLKAPISNIEGLMQTFLRTLKAEGSVSEQIQQISHMMQESVDRFKRTIASLTEVVKLQKENSVEAGAVQLSEVAREVLMDMKGEIEHSGAQVHLSLDGCPDIRFSEKNLRSVVYNLLSNALKYRSPERPLQVQIGCEVTPEYLVLSVSDNGLGIAAERMDQLFTMFKRFHAHVEGTGIGLYMIKKMIENAGGRIEVESQPGQGSTFRAYLLRKE